MVQAKNGTHSFIKKHFEIPNNTINSHNPIFARRAWFWHVASLVYLYSDTVNYFPVTVITINECFLVQSRTRPFILWYR